MLVTLIHINYPSHRVHMRQVNSTDFKNHFGEFVDLVRDEPIEVLRGTKAVGVFISRDEFEHLQAIEDAYWGASVRPPWRGGIS